MMQLRSLCLLAAAICCSGQGVTTTMREAPRGGNHSHEADRFMVTIGTPRPFDDARAFCGPDKYLLNLAFATDVSHIRATFQEHRLNSSYVWVNLRIIEGFFHWLDPIPRLFLQGNYSPYGNKIAYDNPYDECAVLKISSGVIETRPCDDQYEFLCVEDKQFTPVDVSDETVSVEIFSNRSPVLLSWNLPDLVLECRATLRNGNELKTTSPNSYAYVWTKNGVYLDHTDSSLQPEKVSEPNAYTHTNQSSQGGYRCGLKALPSGHTVWSQVVTVVLEDFDTYRFTGNPINVTSLEPIQFIGNKFATYAGRIQAALKSTDVDGWSYAGMTAKDNKPIVVSIFLYYKKPELLSIAQVPRRQYNIANASSALQSLLTEVEITDVLHCEETSQGSFAFYRTGRVGLIESSPLCITESRHLVPRMCNINFKSKPTWEGYNESACTITAQTSAFDFSTDSHPLICGPGDCYMRRVSGTWSEAWRACNDMRSYLASDGPGSWTDLVKKNGYFQSSSAGHPEVLEALKRSELLVPVALPQDVIMDACYMTMAGTNEPQMTLSSDSIMQTSCSDHLNATCVPRYHVLLRSLTPCPRGGWLAFSNNKTCLWLNSSPATYREAGRSCSERGGRLAVVDDASLAYTISLLLLPPEVSRQFDHYWIGLQKTQSHSYEWNNGEPLQHLAWHPRTDYNQSSGTLHVDRYTLHAGMALRFSLQKPSKKLPYLCQAPLKTGTAWIRVESKDTDRRVVLTCRVSAEIIPGSILWYKDGIAVHGDRARMPSDQDTTLVIDGATQDSPYLQGYYWCEGLNIDNFRPVESKKTLVRLKGIKSYACNMSLVGRNPHLYDISSSMALRFASEFRRDFFQATRDTITGGYHMYELRVVDVTEGIRGRDIVRFLVFFKRLRRLPRMASQEEEVSIIEWLNATVRNSSERLNTTPSVLPDTLAIKSTELCFMDTTMHSSGLQSVLTWPTTPIGAVAIPDKTCIQADGQPAVRRCEGQFTTGAYWGDVQGMCERNARNTTLDLRSLSLEIITNETMVPTAGRLQELTADSGSLEALDVLYAARTMENIVSAGSIGVQAVQDIVSTLDNVVRADSEVLQQSRSGNSTNRILTAMEELSAGLSTNTLIVQGSVAVAKVPQVNPSQGIAIHLRDNRTYSFSYPERLTEGTDAAFMIYEGAYPAVDLTINIMKNNALFEDVTREKDEDENVHNVYSVCTSVLQVKYVMERDSSMEFNKDTSFSFYFKQTCDIVPEEIECVFWDVNKNKNLGSWSGDGCEYVGTVEGYHLCNCTHLTSFAVLFRYNSRNRHGGNLHDAILSYLTMTGVAISASGLFMVVLTYLFFKKWRKGTGHQILFNLCLSLLGALASFLTLAALPKSRTSLTSCTCKGAALHYFLLVSFAWTFVEALLQYLRFVRVLGTYVPNLVLKAAFGAWGAPMLVILCVLIVNPTHYHKRKDLCWLEGEALLYSFLVPVGLILAGNVIVFCMVVSSIYCRRQEGLRSTQSQVALAKAQLRATVCIVFLLGLTWIFAYLSLIEAVSKEWGQLFEYLFVITSTLQGLVIFIFHIAYEKTAREFWLGQIAYRLRPYTRKRSFDRSSTKITLSTSGHKTTST